MSGFVRGKLLVILLGLSVVFSPLSVLSQNSRTIVNPIAVSIVAGETPYGEGDWKPDKGRLEGVDGNMSAAATL